jgi:hypothetical protein
MLDPFSDPLIQDVQRRHDVAVAGDKKIVTDLIADLEKWTGQHPEHHLLRAYLGSAYTLRSRDLFPGPSKLRYLKDGLKLMDDAVAAAPQEISVRFIRALNNFNLPAFLNRRDNARSDFKILLTEVSQPSTATHLNLQTKQAIHYYAGLVHRQLNDLPTARSSWEAGLGLDATSSLGKKMALELKKLPR